MKFITSERLRIAIAMTAGVLTVVILASWFSFGQAESESDTALVSYVPSVYLSSTATPILVSGVVAAADNTIVYAETAGVITGLPAREGSMVSVGQLLSVQSTPVLDAQVAVVNAQAELSNLQQSSETAVAISLLEQSQLRTYSAIEIALLRQNNNDNRLAETSAALLIALELSVLSATEAINYVNTNRPLFTAEGLALYDEVVTELYGQIPNYFHSGIGQTVTSEQDLIALINDIQTATNLSPVVLEEVSSLVLRQLQVLSHLFTTAEADVFDRHSDFVTSDTQAEYLSARTNVITAGQSLQTTQSSLSLVLDSLLEDVVSQDSGVAVTKVDEEIAAIRAEYSQLISNQINLLSQAQSAVVVAERSLGHVQAPFAGVVSKVHVDGGEYVMAGTPLLTLVGSGARELEVTVPAFILNELTVGQKFVVDGVVSGTVSRFSRVAEAGGGTVVISLSTPELVTVGSSLVGSLLVETDQSWYGAPRAYVHFDNDGPYIKYTTGALARVEVIYDNGQTLFVTLTKVSDAPLVAATSITLK